VQHAAITEVDLSNNNLQSEDVNLIFDSLKDRPLNKLDLSWNQLGRQSVEHIVTNMASSILFKSLEHLGLASTRLSFVDERLFRVLSPRASLRAQKLLSCDLRYNYCSKMQLESIFLQCYLMIVEKSTSQLLLDLDLRFNSIFFGVMNLEALRGSVESVIYFDGLD